MHFDIGGKALNRYTLGATHSLITQDDLEDTISMTGQHIELRDQLRDYQYQGQEPVLSNLFDFMINTYEVTAMDEHLATGPDVSEEVK